MNSTRRGLYWALAAYAVLVMVVSVCQRDRINSDFIGYITVSQRLLHDFRGSVSGHWSPLFSWLMVPMILAGMPDLVAGRVVLVASGFVYIWAIHAIVRRFGRVIVVGMLTCAVIQAAVWATYLLDPDLLAAALMFAYCATVLDAGLARKPMKALGGGLLAGLAYLAKAYMFPFALVHLSATFWLRRRLEKGNWLVAWLLSTAGLLLLVLPWAGVLSLHEHRLTFSTAGSSNHANVSPENDGHDPLFTPGLVADYTLEPRLEPDWSPFSSWRNFRYQAGIVGRNLNVTFGYVPLWGVLVLAACGWRLAARNLLRRFDPEERFLLWWAFITIAIYVAGYSLVIVEARYMVPVCAPLLCLVGLILLKDFDAAPSAAVIGLILLVSAQQIQRLVQNATVHYQTRDVRTMMRIARELQRIAPMGNFASNRWHDALVVAYLDGRERSYLGVPKSGLTPAAMRELDAAGADIYLRLLDAGEPETGWFGSDAIIPVGWSRAAELDSGLWHAEIYLRPK